MGTVDKGRAWLAEMVHIEAKVVLCVALLACLSSAQLFGPPNPRTVGRPRQATTRNSFDASDVTNDVLEQLGPEIARLVASLLGGGRPSNSPPAGSFRPGAGASSSGSGSLRPANAKYPPAKYQYEYKVADDLTQTYINQQESRDGLEVEGSYSYVDPQGAIVTVNYRAGVDGYSETRERAPGAADIRPAAPRPAGSSGSGLDIDSLIASVLAALQPQIEIAVQNAAMIYLFDAIIFK